MITLAGLLALTALSWGISQLSLGLAGTCATLLIALTKSLMVLAVFMELAHRGPSIRVVIGTTLAVVAIICLGVASDVLLR